MYKEKSLKEYVNDLSAKLPAPGGGSAAALSAALGASLISMVINFTSDKPKYAAYETQLKVVLLKSDKLKERFLALVDLDVEAYKSKDLKKSLDVPLEVCRLTLDAIELCPQILKKSNVNLISDVAVAAVLLEAAFASAYFNVEINLKSFPDVKLAQDIRKELELSKKTIKQIRADTEAEVGKIIRG